MRFKQIKSPQKLEEEDLFEINMSYSNLQKLVKDIDARAGLEFEMIVPDIKADNEDAEMEPDFDYDEGTYNIGQIVDFFHDGDYNGRGDVRRLENSLSEDFQEWIDESFDARWSADAEEFVYRYLIDDVDPADLADILGIELDSDSDGFTKQQMAEAAERVVAETMQPYYDDARDQARDEFMEEADQQEWLTEVGLDNMSDVHDRYSITWPHWRFPENESGPNMDGVAKSFSQAVGRGVNVSQSYHGGRREEGKYVIEPDGSLSPASDEDEGLEFVSPPLTIPEMLNDLKEVMAWANSTGCYTNKSTGLHMNVSVPGYDESKLDFVKLALLIGDKYILDQFGRSANTYCRSAIDKINERIKVSGTKDLTGVLETMQKGLNSLASRLIQGPGVGKYTSINPQDNRVEFRSPGGDWLDEPIEKLSGTLLRFVVGLDAAINPEKYKEEYYKKFYKLVTPAFEQDNQLQKVLSLYMSGDKEQARTQAQQLKIQKQAKRELVPGQKYEWEVMKIADKGRDSYYSVRVIATTEKEAISKGMAAGGIPFNNIDPDELMAIPKSVYKEPSTTDTTSGDWYAIQRLRAIGGNETVHRFKAQNRTEAEQTTSQYIADRRWDPRDYIVIRQQPPSGQTQPSSQNTTPPPELNGRPSNPDGNVYIASRENPEVPLYRFMAADGNDVRTVLNQWREQYGSNYIYRIDHLQLQGQPRQAQTAEPIGRVRPAGPSQPAWQAPGSPRAGVPQGQEVLERLLGMADQTVDANYEIVRRDNYQPVFLFIANTPQDASRVLERYLEVIGLDQDSEEFGFRERAQPGSTLDLQRRRVEQSARAAVQSTSGNRLWQIVDSANGEVAYEFYLSAENNQQDANEVGLRWVRNNGDPTTTYSVREQPQQTGTVTPQNQEGSIQWRILVGGEEVHRFWNRSNQGEANAVARQWTQDQIRRGLLSVEQGADVEVVPVQA